MHTDSSHRLIALVGTPNSGKTTLYNWLTHSRFKTTNYPGATVEYSIGTLKVGPSEDWRVMDTPGTYSMQPKSEDEEVTLRALYNHQEGLEVSHVIVVVDATQFSRQIPLALQLKEAGFSIVVALTMGDLIHKQGIEVDLDLISKTLGIPVVLVDGNLGGNLDALVKEVQKLPHSKHLSVEPWTKQRLEQCHNELQNLSSRAFQTQGKSAQDRINRLYARVSNLDRILIHPVFGLVVFIGIMTLLFSSIYYMAAPAMDYVESLFGGLAGIAATSLGEGLFTDFVTDGLIASFAAVLVFVPQIFILFFVIGLLEASGYLARAATIIDRPLSSLGMGGRSFVPLLSGFACAVPAMIASRNIPSKKERLLTNFIIPLMTCSARLPVYALLIGFLFTKENFWLGGFILALLYFSAMIFGALVAGVVNKFIPEKSKSFFVMELPLFRWPRWKVILKQSYDRTKSYVTRAGPPIFTFAVLIWLGTTFPNYQAEPVERLQTSYLATAGQMIEPLFKPMGLDWRAGVGLMSAFAAREVFVSSLAVMFNIADAEETEGLLAAMRSASFADGTPIFTIASCIGLIIFFMIALQCMSTYAVSVRENGSWRFATAQLVVFNLVAYALAVIAVQGLRLVGVG